MTNPGVVTDAAYGLPPMTAAERDAFEAYFPRIRRDEVLGVLLALLLGSFGAHHFYLRRNGLGVVYLLFFWTGIPGLLGLIEAFFMPGRVQRFNMEAAMQLAWSLREGFVPAGSPRLTACPGCGSAQQSGARFCARCGRSLV